MDCNRFQGCAKCGMMSGEMVTCSSCGDSYHNRTCLSDSERPSSKSVWKCSQCVASLNRPFVPSDVTCNEDYYSYLDMFSIETLDGFNSEPTIGAILLRMEWVMTNDKVADVAKCVSKYFSVVRGSSQNDGGNALFHSSKTLNFHRLIDSLRLIVGNEEFESMYNQLVNQEYTISVGMAPSLQWFIRKCYTCGAFRYLRSFCYNCGSLFNAKIDACRDMNLRSSSRRIKEDPVSKSSSLASTDSSNIQLTKHEEVALRALQRFVSATDKPRNYFHFGGDIFFLLRNIATNCAPGVVRELAKSHFKQMCDRWLDDPPDQLLHDEDPHLEASVSSCQVIQCLVTKDHVVRRMYLEPANIPAAKYLERNRTNCSSISLDSLSRSGSSKSKHKKSERRKDRDEQILRVKNSIANSVAPTNYRRDRMEVDCDDTDTVPYRSPEAVQRSNSNSSARQSTRSKSGDSDFRKARKRLLYNVDEDVEEEEEFELTEQEAALIAQDYLKMAKRESRHSGEFKSQFGDRGVGVSSSYSASGSSNSNPVGVVVKNEMKIKTEPEKVVVASADASSSMVIDLTLSSEDECATAPKRGGAVQVKTPHSKQVVQSLTQPLPGPPPTPVLSSNSGGTTTKPSTTSLSIPTLANVAALPKGAVVRVTADDTYSLQSISDDELDTAIVKKEPPTVKKEVPSRIPDALPSGKGIEKLKPVSTAAAAAAKSVDSAAAVKPKPSRKRRQYDTESEESSDDEGYYSAQYGDSSDEEEWGPRFTRSRLGGTGSSSTQPYRGGAAPDRRLTSGVKTTAVGELTGIVPVARHQEILDSVNIMERLNSTLQDIKNRIVVFISALSIIELVNVDPNEKGVPMTPLWHCQHCGANNLRNGYKGGKNGSSNNLAGKDSKTTKRNDSSSNLREEGGVGEEDVRYCDGENGKKCGYPIVPAIDYCSLTESLCWAYIYQCMGIDMDTKNTPERKGEGIHIDSLSKIVRQLPLMRSYSTLGQIGIQFYKHQCYFITHLIYVFSDYGQHTLRRQLFAEEFYFMATQMSIVIHSLEDAEIVGEFIHCLQILQFTEEEDPELVDLILEAKEFLVQREEDLGKKGKFVVSHEVKNQYHASYCGVIGLMDSTFTKDDAARWSPPRPNILSMLR